MSLYYYLLFMNYKIYKTHDSKMFMAMDLITLRAAENQGKPNLWNIKTAKNSRIK